MDLPAGPCERDVSWLSSDAADVGLAASHDRRVIGSQVLYTVDGPAEADKTDS